MQKRARGREGRSRRSLWLVACLPLVLALAAQAKTTTTPLPGKAPQPRPEEYDASTENQRCEQCHADIAMEWRASLHHKAWDDPVFLTAYALEPLAFCRACHVPEANPTGVPGESARRLGIGCVTCHAPAGEIVSAHGQTANEGRHATRGDARLATAMACRGCHQFDFPDPQEAPMQGTHDEHRASPNAAKSCQECHMPLVLAPDGAKHHNHDFRVIGNAALLKTAITVKAVRGGASDVLLSLSAGRVGHAVPTGDMFRRLEVRAWAGDKKDALSAKPVFLARRFVMLPRAGHLGIQRMQVGDDRVPATGEAREARLVFPRGVREKDVFWQVVYQRMPSGMAADFGVDNEIDEVILAEGQMPAEKGVSAAP